jgi:hypothetical protein
LSKYATILKIPTSCLPRLALPMQKKKKIEVKR